MIVAIHQPNYAPWLGYFHKIARADLFVFLDDAQFSKGSYTNRVQILENGAPRWLTIPVRHDFGAPINHVGLAREDWARAHLDTLHGAYKKAVCFGEMWPDIEAFYSNLPGQSLAAVNAALIQRMADKLGIATPMRLASSIDVGSAFGDDRLIALCRSFGDHLEYLSGRGGAKYQSEAKFAAAGISLRYTDFQQTPYAQGEGSFLAGLSTLDAVFHLGWKGAAELVRS